MGNYVYILKCGDGSYYIGSTRNIENRFWQHQIGKGSEYTKKRLPVVLVYLEQYERIDDAFNREKQLQGWSRKKKEALVKGDDNLLYQLSECENITNSKTVGLNQYAKC